ncbi:hypothetical protein MRX96_029859 [Rhipicephalus microplus]
MAARPGGLCGCLTLLQCLNCPKGRETVPPGDLAALEGHPSPAARVITVPGSTWFLGPAEPPKESPAINQRGGPTSGSRRPPGVIRVYKPFLACHSRPGRQCLLATSTGPGPRDHLAAVVVRAYRPGYQATGTWTSTDEAFQSSQREKTPSGSGEHLQAFSCLPLPVRSPMPAGDTNGPWSSLPLRRHRRRCPGLPARTSIHEILRSGGVPAWRCLPPADHLPSPSSRSPRVPVVVGGVPLPLRV